MQLLKGKLICNETFKSSSQFIGFFLLTNSESIDPLQRDSPKGPNKVYSERTTIPLTINI